LGILVEERRAETLDLAGVVAAPDAKDDPSAGQDVGHRVILCILCEPQRMPHRHDVERPTGNALGRKIVGRLQIDDPNGSRSFEQVD
jgi:hypothetical protein